MPSLVQSPPRTTWRTICAVLLLAVAAQAEAHDAVHNIVDDGWVTESGYQFSGRLTEAHAPANAQDGRRAATYRNSRLLLAGGEAGAVRWSVGPMSWQTRTDPHGYWELQVHPGLTGQLEPGWYVIHSEPDCSSDALVLVHDPRNRFGLISDIDDTVLVSEVPDKRRLLRNTLTLPPERRAAVPGMAELYHALMQHNAKPRAAPVFYVSGSPRQLTDNVRRFLQANAFPPGVLQLKEVGGSQGDPLADQQAYKHRRITAIFEAFPDVRFTLLGDDGERDPEVYAQLQREHPHQVGDIWIRHVSPDPQRARYAGQRDVSELLSERGRR